MLEQSVRSRGVNSTRQAPERKKPCSPGNFLFRFEIRKVRVSAEERSKRDGIYKGEVEKTSKAGLFLRLQHGTWKNVIFNSLSYRKPM